MIYSEEVLDRKTGELISVSKGDWITLNELAELRGVGPRKARCILRRLDFLHLTTGRGDHARHKLAPWAEAAGMGRTNRMTIGQFSFVVVSPEGREWIDERWADALRAHQAEETAEATAAGERFEAFKTDRGREGMTTPEAVAWLAYFEPGLSQSGIASVLDVSQQLVSKHLSSAERRRTSLRRSIEVEPPVKTRWPPRGLNSAINDDPEQCE